MRSTADYNLLLQSQLAQKKKLQANLVTLPLIFGGPLQVILSFAQFTDTVLNDIKAAKALRIKASLHPAPCILHPTPCTLQNADINDLGDHSKSVGEYVGDHSRSLQQLQKCDEIVFDAKSFL